MTIKRGSKSLFGKILSSWKGILIYRIVMLKISVSKLDRAEDQIEFSSGKDFDVIGEKKHP